MLSVFSGEGAVVNGELHLHRRWVDVDGRERFGFFVSGEGFANVGVFEARDTNDVSSNTVLSVLDSEVGVFKNLANFGANLGAVFLEAENGVAFLDGAGEDLSDGDSTDVVIPVDVGNEHFEGSLGIHDRSGDVLDDGFNERDTVSLGHVV